MSNRSRRLRIWNALQEATAVLVTAVMTVGPAQIAFASPSGENVVHGQASVARDGSLTQVTASNGAIIEWTAVQSS